MKPPARASSLYAQTVIELSCYRTLLVLFPVRGGHSQSHLLIKLYYAVFTLIPLFITVILLSIIYCSNLRYFAYNPSKYRLHLYLLIFSKSEAIQNIKNDEYQSRWTLVPFVKSYIL